MIRLFALYSIITLLFETELSAQTGLLNLRVYPIDAIVRLDSQRLNSQSQYTMDTGSYVIQMWAPKHEYISKEFEVKEGETTYIAVRLGPSPEWKAYKTQRLNYRLSRSGLRFGSTALYAAYITGVYARYNRLDREIDQTYNRGMSLKSTYESSVYPEEIETARKNYYELKDYHEQLLVQADRFKIRESVICGAGLIAVLSGYYISTKIKKPEYKERVKLVWAPSYDPWQSRVGLTLQWRFNG